MILGGLVDLGLDPEWLRAFVDSLDLGEIPIEISRVDRCGISCSRVYFDLPEEDTHRHLSDILEIIDSLPLSDSVAERAAAIFRRLAEAEASIHGTSIDEVHFHEVGALDAILDILSAVAGIEELGIERVYTRTVAIGSGYVDIAHGIYPVPAPATLRLLEGLPVRDSGFEGECTTPTGAAILAVIAERGVVPSEVIIESSGYGAGARDPEDHPNCLRLITCRVRSRAERLYMLQSDLDDLSPEYAASAQEALLEGGALDVVVSPIGMKKGRQGIRLEVLVPEAALDSSLELLFRSTSTIGARYWPVERPALERTIEEVEWRGEVIRCKRVTLPGGGERVKPEYDDVARAARATGLTPYEVRRELDRLQ